jgi:hypothetical protein
MGCLVARASRPCEVLSTGETPVPQGALIFVLKHKLREIQANGR